MNHLQMNHMVLIKQNDGCRGKFQWIYKWNIQLMAIGEEFVLLVSRGALLSVVLEKEIFGTSYLGSSSVNLRLPSFFLMRMNVPIYAGSMGCCDIWGWG
jgi:hypothetical protein